ncbi:MAG: flavin reductase family protein [Succinivibrionaceae bacterium]|nr:flavin reductase family protein [Succinivibrionaceae bacterium]
MDNYTNVDTQSAWLLLSGGPLVMVASRSRDGIPNVMAAGWSSNFEFDSPYVALDTTHTTSANIRDTHEFVICVAGIELKDAMLYSGTVHGRDVGDKFKAGNIRGMASPRLGITIPAGCLAYLECTVLPKWRPLFAEEGLLIGHVEAAAAREGLWDEDAQSFGKGLMLAMHYVSEKTISVGGELISVGSRH